MELVFLEEPRGARDNIISLNVNIERDSASVIRPARTRDLFAE